MEVPHLEAVQLEVETILAALSSWMVVAPGFTMKPEPDWSLVTEPSVYTMRSYSWLFSSMPEKLGL